jgi:pimeloyl-ACP methyl ester carboxylesterase
VAGWFIIILVLAFAGGCNRIMADRLIAAQNRRTRPTPLDAPAAVLEEFRVAHQLRVNAGPPAASLSVWVIDPPPDDRTIVLKGDGQTIVMRRQQPETRPATQATRMTSPATTRLAPPRELRGTIFILHGISHHKEMLPYQFWATLLGASGYRCVLVDLRGHGRSTGDHITYGEAESRDLLRVLDELHRRGLVVGDVGVFGGSFGGSIAIIWASIDSRVKAVVALEPFSSFRDAAMDAGPAVLGRWGWLYRRRDYEQVVRIAARRGGFDPVASSPIAAIARAGAPVLLIHGRDDTFIPPAHSERLHAAAPGRTRLVLVDKADHVTLWQDAAELILRASTAWFGRYLAQPLPTTATTAATRRGDP